MALALIRKTVPEADDAIVDYIDGYLKDANFDDDDEDAIADFVKPILLDAGGDEAKIDELCEQLINMLASNKKETTPLKGLSKLENTVVMGQQSGLSATAMFSKGSVDLDHVSGRRVQSQVNQDKLRKAEAKIAAKMAKRAEKTNMRIEYEASRLIESEQKALQEAYKLYNPILDYTSTKGKNKDIKIENFDISFAGRRILTDANLTLAFGRRYGVVGKNGIGKSTLLRAISRREVNVPHHISVLYVEQEVIGDNTPAIEMVLRADVWREHLLEKERDLSAQINLIEAQQSEGELTEEEKKEFEAQKDRINGELKDVFAKLQEIESDKAESKASAILAGLGFPTPDQKRPTREFSGGWRMRISLARALFCKPDVLMLDEPDNMLDIPAIVWLESYLKTWPNTLLVVSHDREFLDEVATDILFMHSEKLDYYKGNYTQFYATKEERRKAQIREYESQMQYRKHLQDFIDRWRYNAKRAPQAQARIKILEKLPELEPPEDEKIVKFQFANPEQLSPPILQMNEVTFGYNPEKVIIRNINIDVRMDSRIAIVGPNGAGKSTMLKLLTEENKPMSGMVHRNGRLRIAYFTQHHIDQLDLTKSAVAFMADRFPGKPEEEYRRHLGSFGITGMVGLQVMKTLSGGQKSRVAFACLSAQNPHILVLDEPTNHLDMESMDALQTALGQFQGGVIMVSHDERFISTVCHEIWVCADGVLSKFSGTIKDYKELVCPKDTVL
ncbi:P-loop containing nucleoside triphosphate hydrolase protein [Radiomyces spectabilis]|uniref:P-loop containing nucleoside triphosphate hydrolase protein n=1 Tax=Radiomyces spectabilis TaxID=64574 RepID=UPI002220A526|nr:P-loop containing nucleoside triphosphate hydrolase protein [Radiomyces spectabilis]KAI8377871.1 P-loop containing nucleoside triphosphate hydrolase protein [Radiomyces spectabilis]